MRETKMETVRSTPMAYDGWMAAAREEYRRLDGLLRDLGPDEWTRPTDCDEWDVRAMVAHLVGAAEANASVREMLRQAWVGRRVRRDGDLVDKMNAVQVAERADRAPAELVGDLASSGARGVAARSRLPAPVRAVPLPFGPPLGVRPLGYLMGRIYTRDAWMHRVDICRATGRQPVLTPDHDGRLVDDVVQEWAAAHGSPYWLELTGRAGGSWGTPGSGERIQLDAVDFCRTVSGREPGAGLLTTRVPF
jgi:uncharacterized protein (TIGR03083 family)